MTNRYIDLIDQTFYFPQEGFKVNNDHLYFNDISLINLVEQYGTPLRLTYLPSISSQIQKAKKLFNGAIKKLNYKGKYVFSYCIKGSQFSFVLDEALKNDIHLETSSAFDIDLIEKLHATNKIKKDIYVICNGYKPINYIKKISQLINTGFENVIPVLDNVNELAAYEQQVERDCELGIRAATDEEPNFEFYTSRLGIRYESILDFCRTQIKDKKKFKLKMLHFFINTGIKDKTYYWNELLKALKIYCQLKKICPELTILNIGGGFPIRNSLGFEYDYGYMAQEIVNQIKTICRQEAILEPDIFTEFGTFTVGESGAVIFCVLDEKLQNDTELWYMIDGSFITTLPDVWSIGQRFILLPINKWNNKYQQVNIGGLTCDSQDYYNSEVHLNQVFLPKINSSPPTQVSPTSISGQAGGQAKEPLYIGYFHTGAYQEALSGYGGIKHCLIPACKHVLINKDGKGKRHFKLFAPQQEVSSMFNYLGY